MNEDESLFKWKDTLCILRPLYEKGQQRFISIIGNDVSVLTMDRIFGLEIDENQIFFKLRTGIKPGCSWTKVLDWEIEDYESVIGNKTVMWKLTNTISPNPTYIEEMKSKLRDLKINDIINDLT